MTFFESRSKQDEQQQQTPGNFFHTVSIISGREGAPPNLLRTQDEGEINNKDGEKRRKRRKISFAAVLVGVGASSGRQVICLSSSPSESGLFCFVRLFGCSPAQRVSTFRFLRQTVRQWSRRTKFHHTYAQNREVCAKS